MKFPEPWGEGFDVDILFRAECSKVSCFFAHLAVGLFACPYLLQEKASLIMAVKGTEDPVLN